MIREAVRQPLNRCVPEFEQSADLLLSSLREKRVPTVKESSKISAAVRTNACVVPLRALDGESPERAFFNVFVRN
jgi:hypothetical protein